MNPIIKFVNENTTDDIVNYIKNNSTDRENSIRLCLVSRTEYELKIQKIVDQLTDRLDKLEVGTILEAKEDCMNNFRKGERIEITKMMGNKIVIDNSCQTDVDTIRKYFNIVGHT